MNEEIEIHEIEDGENLIHEKSDTETNFNEHLTDTEVEESDFQEDERRGNTYI